MSDKNNETTAEKESEEQQTRALEFSDIWKGVIKFWWVSFVLGLLFCVIMFFRSYSAFSPTYTVSATFTVNTQSQSLTGEGLPTYSYYYDNVTATQLANTFPYILSSSILSESIYEDLGISYLPVTLSASAVSTTNMFVLTATGNDPLLTYDVLVSAMNNYPKAAKYLIGNVILNVITIPSVPTEPVNKFTPDVATKGFAIGVLLGGVWIVIYALIRKTIKTRADIKKHLKLDVVGMIPEVTFKKYKREKIDHSILITNEKIGRGFMESMRLMRNSFINMLDDDEKVIMATSTAQSEGKTTVIVNIGLSLKNIGKKILIIDADLRNPSVGPALKINSDELEYTTVEDLYSMTTLEEYGVDYLKFMGADKNYWKIINTEYLKSVFDKYRDEYDYILVDTPPCGLISDTATIAEACDAAVYVVLQDTVRVRRILGGLDSILHTDTHVLGIIMNGALSGLAGYGEDYGYGYGNYGHYKTYTKYGYGYGGGYGYGYGDNIFESKLLKSRIEKGKEKEAEEIAEMEAFMEQNPDAPFPPLSKKERKKAKKMKKENPENSPEE